jgi:hypothetical protein
MFGHKKLLTEGAQAQAVITDLTPKIEGDTILMGGAGGQMHQTPNPRAGQVSAYELHTQVTFEDEATEDETFTTGWGDWTEISDRLDANAHHGFIHVTAVGAEDQAVFASLEGRLQPGKTVPVRYDPSHREKIVLDLPALREEVYAQRPAEQADAPGELTAALGSGPLADILQQATQDPEGLRARLLAQAQGSGASAFVVTEAGVAPLSSAVGQQTDVADQLSKLADLHDRGVLTDAEFEAEKQKLLGT